MSSLLRPTYTLTLGSQRWTSQVRRIRLTLATAPRVDALTVEFPIAAPFSAGIGDPAELDLDGGEGDAPVFLGTIDSVRRSLDSLRVTCLNGGGVLARFRPAVAYEQITTGNVVRKLCAEADVDTGAIEEGVPLLYYAADPARTALDHIARVCGWSGSIARVLPGNQVESLVVNATRADSALRYGRDLLGLHHRKVSAPVRSFVVAGEGGAGGTSDPEAGRPSTDFFAGRRPDGPSAAARWSSEPALRTPRAAATAAASRQRAYDSGREQGWFDALLRPGLRPGSVLEIRGLPAGLPSGPLWVGHLRHTIGPEGALTRAYFVKGGDRFDPLALLGSILGAVGGVL